ncbi:hypothetical protein ACFL6I_29255, partial [candidate division KSB1 bacterium]
LVDEFANNDGDSEPDCIDPDDDNDTVEDVNDNCPWDANINQDDLDTDGAGDVCDICPDDAADDEDGDGVCAGTGFQAPKVGDKDNCPVDANPGQENLDGDDLGDACDDLDNTCSELIIPGEEFAPMLTGQVNVINILGNDPKLDFEITSMETGDIIHIDIEDTWDVSVIGMDHCNAMVEYGFAMADPMNFNYYVTGVMDETNVPPYTPTLDFNAFRGFNEGVTFDDDAPRQYVPDTEVRTDGTITPNNFGFEAFELTLQFLRGDIREALAPGEEEPYNTIYLARRSEESEVLNIQGQLNSGTIAQMDVAPDSAVTNRTGFSALTNAVLYAVPMGYGEVSPGSGGALDYDLSQNSNLLLSGSVNAPAEGYEIDVFTPIFGTFAEAAVADLAGPAPYDLDTYQDAASTRFVLNTDQFTLELSSDLSDEEAEAVADAFDTEAFEALLGLGDEAVFATDPVTGETEVTVYDDGELVTSGTFDPDQTFASGVNAYVRGANVPAEGISVPGLSPLEGAVVHAYDMPCATTYGNDYESTVANCTPANTCVTNADGKCTVFLNPADYRMIVTSDLFPGLLANNKNVAAVEADTFAKKNYMFINSPGDQKNPGKGSKHSGSELWVFEPAYVVWDGTEEYYPFVFISDSEWEIDVCVEAPEGYVPVDAVNCLQTVVADEAKSILFKLVEQVGDDAGKVPGNVKVNMNLKNPKG